MPEADPQLQLKRALGPLDLLVYGLIFIVPLAPVGVFGFVFNASGGMVPLVYAIGLVVMVFTAISYVTMTRVIPTAGSVYAYASRAIGDHAGFLAGWAMVLDYLLAPALIFVGSAIAMTLVMPGVPKPFWVVAFVASTAAVNYFGIESTARFSRVLLVVQLAFLVAFVVFAVQAVNSGVNGAHWSVAPLWDGAKLNPALVFGALSLAALSFLGFDAISTLSEEAKGGARDVGRATLLSLALSAVLFILQTYLASLFVLDVASFPAGDDAANAMLVISGVIGGEGFKIAFTVVGIILSNLACAVAAQAAVSRLLFSMARDGRMPAVLARLEPKRRVPNSALLVVAAVNLAVSLAMVDDPEMLVAMVNFGAIFGFLMLHLSVLAYFGRRGELRRGWMRLLVVPIVGFVMLAYVLANMDTTAKLAGITWLLVGGAAIAARVARQRFARAL